MAAEESSLALQVLEALLARDSVQAALKKTDSVPTTAFLRLDEQDKRLKACKENIHRITQLPSWRTLINPPHEAWWWFIEPPALFAWLDKSHPFLDRFDWLWKLTTLFSLAISATIILNTLQRVLAGGLNQSAFIAVIAQTFLVLAGGSTLTHYGREAIESVMTLVHIPKHFWQELSTGLAVICLGIVISIHSIYLPLLATNFYRDGIKQYASGRIGSALLSYQQAIALRPGYTEAHYSLGLLYDDLQQADKAIKEYQQVIQHGYTSLNLLTQLRTRNNLGRLFILDKKYSDALIPLNEALILINKTSHADKGILQEKYNLFKNLGWLRLEQKHYIDASAFLRQAIELGLKRASAYCLQAELLERTSRVNEAVAFWEDCIRYSVSSNRDDAMRAPNARDRLAGKMQP